MKKLILIGLSLCLAGCQLFTRLPDTQSVVKNSGNDFEITVPGGWVKYNSGKEDEVVLTKDGPSLQLITIDQRSLSKPFEHLDVKLDSSALISEIAEHFIEDYKVMHQGVSIEKESLVPVSMNGNDGFKLVLNAINSGGLEFKILVYAMQTDKKLYTLSYQSPVLFFYNKEVEAFERIAESFQVKKHS